MCALNTLDVGDDAWKLFDSSGYVCYIALYLFVIGFQNGTLDTGTSQNKDNVKFSP